MDLTDYRRERFGNFFVLLLAIGTFFGGLGLRVIVWVLAALTLLTSVQRMILVAGAMAAREAEEKVDSSEIGTVPPRV